MKTVEITITSDDTPIITFDMRGKDMSTFMKILSVFDKKVRDIKEQE